ncbi:hypothetical protein IKZ40_08985 [bacterium]|nr:hypothetical protein [bacterium]
MANNKIPQFSFKPSWEPHCEEPNTTHGFFTMSNDQLKFSPAGELGRKAGQYFGSRSDNHTYKDWHDFAQKELGLPISDSVELCTASRCENVDWRDPRPKRREGYTNFADLDVENSNDYSPALDGSAARLGREAGAKAASRAKQNDESQKTSDDYASNYWRNWASQTFPEAATENAFDNYDDNGQIFGTTLKDVDGVLGDTSGMPKVDILEHNPETPPPLNIYRDLDSFMAFLESETKSRGIASSVRPRVNHWFQVDKQLSGPHDDLSFKSNRPSDEQIDSDLNALTQILQPTLRRLRKRSQYRSPFTRALSTGYNTLKYYGNLADDCYFRGATYAGNVLGYLIADMIADLYGMPYTYRNCDDLFGTINQRVPIEGRSLYAYLKAIENGENTEDWFAHAIDMDVFHNWRPETEAGRKFKARLAEAFDVLSPSELAKGYVLSKANKIIAKPLGEIINETITEESYPRLQKWIKNGVDLVDNALGAGESVHDAFDRSENEE